MTKINRRDFLNVLGMGTLISPLGCGPSIFTDNKRHESSRSESFRAETVPQNLGLSARIVVVGGGMGGATAAKYLRLWGGSGVSVTLIDREIEYTSNIMSNLVLNGSTSMKALKFSYSALVKNYGVNFVQGEVSDVDSQAKKVSLGNGGMWSYDKLILAPGIEFDTVPGLETAEAQSRIPHAWKAGDQTAILRDQIMAMPQGGVFVITIPKAPYRCPPGPYERACLVADYLKKSNRTAKVIVLDANPKIVAEEKNFGWAFGNLYPDILEYRPNTNVMSVDVKSKILSTDFGLVRGDVLNVIPDQRAGSLIQRAHLNNVNGRWAGVDVLNYESTEAGHIHVLGDSAATTQPKAGHIANQEAKVCVDAIVRSLAGEAPDPQPVTNSACYSPVAGDLASWLTSVFVYDSGLKEMKNVNGSVEAALPSTKSFKEMRTWFDVLMRESFS